jgi:VCBS repeat-containing protein
MSKNGPGKKSIKLLSIVLSILLIIGMLPQIAFAASPDYKIFSGYENADFTRISFTSDVHLNENNNRIRFTKYMETLADLNNDKKPQMLVFCGDPYSFSGAAFVSATKSDYPWMADGQSFTSPYNEIRGVVAHYLGENFPVVFIAGNHDWETGANYTANSGYDQYYGVLPTKNFDVFLFGAPSMPGSGVAGPYNENEIEELHTYLDERPDKTKPVFVAAHYPLDDPFESDRNATNASEVQTVLEGAGQPVTFMWGHAHTNPRPTMAELYEVYPNYTTFNAGAIGFRNVTNFCQGTNVTLVPEYRELEFSVLRIPTSGSSTEFGSLIQGFPSGAEKPDIGTVGNVTVNRNASAELSVTAHVSDGGNLSFQWFQNTRNSNISGAVVTGATSAAFSPPTDDAGTKYYYCKVKNTLGEGDGVKIATSTSNAARVRVKDGTGDVWDGATIATEFGGGTGSQDDPFLIEDGEQLAYLAQTVNGGEGYAGKYFLQTADIDLGVNNTWTPIGSYFTSNTSVTNHPFSGTYDGDGYKIFNLTIKQDFTGADSINKAYGLFGYLTGTVKNAGLINEAVSVINRKNSQGNAGAYAGGIAGYVGNDTSGGNIYNSYVAGNPLPEGFPATSFYAKTNQSDAKCMAGGIAGYFDRGAIVNCYAAVQASIGEQTHGSSSGAGGLAGYRESDGSFTTSYWDATLCEFNMNGGSAAVDGVTEKTTAEMQTSDFAELLGEHRVENMKWMRDAGINGGYPVHGPRDAEKPKITRQPEDKTAMVGGDVTLSVDAKVRAGTLSYQWYCNEEFSNSGGEPIQGATGKNYPAPTNIAGAAFYYCIVTNHDASVAGEKDATAASDAVEVTVKLDAAWDGSATAFDETAAGTEQDPYLIENAEQLAYLAQQVNSEHSYSGKFFKQTADIDLGFREWTPIGIYQGSQGSAKAIPFSGTYNGDGHIISFLKIDQTFTGAVGTNKSYGLFGYLLGTVKNLGLTDSDVYVYNQQTGSSTSTFNAYAGGIAGYAGSSSTGANIVNSFAEGRIYARTSYSSARCAAGGLVGYFSRGAVDNSYAAVSASIGGDYSSGSSGAGGLAGYKASSGTSFTYSYWNIALCKYGMNSSESTVSGASSMTFEEMRSMSLLDLLNQHKGANDNAWMSDYITKLNERLPIHVRTVRDAETPEIKKQPLNTTVNEGEPVTLTIEAETSLGTLYYQWYRDGGTPVSGATEKSFSAPTGTPGVFNYNCVVTNIDNTASGLKVTTATSNLATVTVNALTHAETPEIKKQPEDKTVNAGEALTLTIEAQVSKGDLSYQWYSNDKDDTGGNPIAGASDPRYSVPTGKAGVMYYYCVVKNRDDLATGNKEATVTSRITKVTVKALTYAETPNIKKQPEDKTVSAEETAKLAVSATVDKGDLSYQWYSNDKNSSDGGTLIKDAAKDEFTAPTGKPGIAYYYCIITNTENSATGGKTAIAASEAAKVTVLDTNSGLSGITATEGTLSPAFDPKTLKYTVALGKAVESTTLAVTAASASASVSVDGTAGTSKKVTLENGKSQTVVFKVTAENGDTREYTVAVSRADYGKFEITLNNANGQPIPDVWMSAYKDSALTQLFGSAKSDASGKVVFTGLDAAPYWMKITSVPGGYKAPASAVTLTAEDSQTKTLVIVIDKQEIYAYKNWQLRSLTVSAGKLSPAFDPDTLKYKLKLGEKSASVKITPKKADSASNMYIDGKKVKSVTVKLKPGKGKTVTIQVKPKSGKSYYYKIDVSRAKSSNADLKSIKISKGKLRPNFKASVTAYTLALKSSQSSVKFSLGLASDYADYKFKVDGKSAGKTVSLKKGQTKKAEIIVTAQNGTKKTYTVTITRAK